MTLFAALAMPIYLAAQPPQYTVIDLGTLGGTFSFAGVVNNHAWVSGSSTLPDDTAVHAFFWKSGTMSNLPTLGGPNSAGFPLNERGEVSGVAETSTKDPLGEDPCGFGTFLICLPVTWQDGVITNILPTLGGANGFAREINNRGEVAGFAENTTHDPTCTPPSVVQFKPVLWDNGGQIHELPTVGGDPDGIVFAVNDKGQAVGQTGNCFTSLHGVFWQQGTPTDLGSVEGLQLFPVYINNQAQVVGTAFSPATFIAFLWQRGVATILGTLPGDVASTADGINNKGQVVGGSFDRNGNERAFIWQNGVMTDLNSLVPADSSLFLLEATGKINSRGEIAGIGFQSSTGEVHAFLATPNNDEVASQNATPVVAGAGRQSPRVALPENVRKALRQQLGHRYHIPGLGMGTP